MSKKFWNSVVDGNETTSSKRLITLIVSGHFILSSFAVLFAALYVIFNIPKGQVDKDLLNVLVEILKYDFYIIVSGLGFITIVDSGKVLIEYVKAKFSNVPDFNSTTTTTTLPEECDKENHIQL